jgi:hypothetical protein
MLMTRKLRSLLLVVGLAIAMPAALLAQPLTPTDPEVKQGVAHVEEGDLDGAVAVLDAAIKRLSSEAGHEKDLATAHLYLAMAHLGLSQIESAKVEVRAAWRTNRQMKLDPSRFPPTLIKMYEEASREATAAKPTPFPTMAKKGGGNTGVVLGVLGGAAVVGGVVAASGGGRAAPTPTPASPLRIFNARFNPSQYVCPDGPSGGVIQVPGEQVWRVTADVTDGVSATTTIDSCTFIATIVGSDSPSEIGAHTANMPCSILGGNQVTVNAGILRTIQIAGTDPLGCINTATTHSNNWSGLLTINTVRGRFQLTTTNNLQIVTPVGR